MSISMVRLLGQVAASVGVSKIVNDVIRNNTQILTTSDAVRVWMGSVVIGSMVADSAAKHVDTRITEFVEWRQRNNADAS